MDAWSFLTGASDDAELRELRRQRDAKQLELSAAQADCERLGREIDERIAAWNTARARWRTLQAQLHEADLALLAGPPRPGQH